MSENSVKAKFNYGFAEKIIRIICWASVVLCAIVALLYVAFGNVIGGICVFLICGCGGFLITDFFVSKIKNRFNQHKYKRVFVAIVYLLVLAFVFSSTLILVSLNSHSEAELSNACIDYVKNGIEEKYKNNDLKIDEIEIEEHCKNVNSYFFKISCDYFLDGERIFTYTYVQVNKENAKITTISLTDYILAYNSAF